MSPINARPLQLWEQIGFSINISTYVDLQGRGVSGETLTRAFQALQQEHPVLRMGVEYQDNVAKFAEVAKSTFALTTASTLYPSWQIKLQEFANEFRDWSETIVYAELASNDEQHQLFLTVNHAGDVSWSLTKLPEHRHHDSHAYTFCQTSMLLLMLTDLQALHTCTLHMCTHANKIT